MPVSSQMDAGKWDQPSVKAADDDGLGSRRIFVTDKATLISFLMDTDADISVYPRSKKYELFAANGTRISTYGTIAVSLNLSLRRAFT